MTTAAQPHSIQFHGLGLLTTVASLPPKYRSRYLSVKTKCETPLDLSVKPLSPMPTPTLTTLTALTTTATTTAITITTTTPTPTTSPQIANDVPIATTFTDVYTEPETAPTTTTMSVAVPTPESETDEHDEREAEQMFVQEEVIITTEPQPQKQPQTAQKTELTAVASTATPPLSPAGKRKFVELKSKEQQKTAATVDYEHPKKMAKTRANPTITRVATPTKPIKGNETASRPGKVATPSTKPTRTKATRKLKFDEETSSPVSGTIIRPLEDITDGTVQYSNGDIDPKYNIVEITEETKAELAAIKNVIGDYVCKLCRIKFDDAFGLARHRCACIVLLEYRCPECGKQFNCPANLASHRRWHKPKKEAAAAASAASTTVKKENRNTTNQQAIGGKKNVDEFAYACAECGKKFKRQAYLRKHQQTHTKAAAAAVAATGKENVATTFMPTSSSSSTTTTTATIVATFQTSKYVSSASGSSASGSSSDASCASTHEDEGVYVGRTPSYDYDGDSLSDDCSSTSSSAGYGRLQIVEHGITEEESIAAAALTNLRNCASVIQHTTMAH